MERFNSSDVLFFFGAGASAPFGIPTMKQFVENFEKHLKHMADQKELELYSNIKETLEALIGEPQDLEAIFSVIDGIINYDDPRKLGMFPLYFAASFRSNFPNKDHVATAKKLKQKFQTYIKENCALPESTINKIEIVYKDLFNRVALESNPSKSDFKCAWDNSWTIFTTNYDLVLEHYWVEIAGCGIDTNFEYNPHKKMHILSPNQILNEPIESIKLFKLHGSINWLIDAKTKDVIEVMETGKSLIGRKYIGELMLYPIAEKQLYLEPYISMFVRLNRELERRNIWIVIGYSFNDEVIREIFLKHCSEKKHLILVHPNAPDVVNKKMSSAQAKISPLKEKFGLTEEEALNSNCTPFDEVNYNIMYTILGKEPRYGAMERMFKALKVQSDAMKSTHENSK